MQSIINENERLKAQNRSLQQENRALKDKLTNGLMDKDVIELIREIARLKANEQKLYEILKNKNK